MTIYRIAKAAFKNDLSGQGAELAGGRWNSKGRAMVYTSGSRALCMLEVAVHIPLHLMPDDYWLVSISVPETIAIQELKTTKLPAGWKSKPPIHATQQIGDEFLQAGQFAVLKVPSVIVPGEFNYLVNPVHRQAKKIKVVAMSPFPFDERLFRQ